MALLDNPLGALTALDGGLSGGSRHAAASPHTHDFHQRSNCGTCRVLGGRDPADITLAKLDTLRDDIRAIGQPPRVFSSRDEDWRCYQDALTGADKVRLDVRSLDGYQGKAWGDIGRGGSVVFNEDLLACERALKANADYTISERACVLLDMSALIVHEVRHTCWTNETGAYSVDGWFRYNIQKRLGISTATFCGQTSWRCGTSTSSADGCKNRTTLRDDVISIADATSPSVCNV
ncbi:MAG: hypothetical protein GXP62_01315 [Oligoflexia bacterium]|nr:hypothetical protein [Oligoflexia bacterium]